MAKTRGKTKSAGKKNGRAFLKEIGGGNRKNRNFRDMIHRSTPFRSAVESMQLGVTITDHMGKIIYTNPADAAMHGYEVQEIIGKDVRLFAPASLWKPMRREDLEQVNSLTRESVNVRKDGSTFPVRLWSDVVRDETGTPIAVVTSCEDLTKNREMEKFLADGREITRGVFDNVTDIVQSVGGKHECH